MRAAFWKFPTDVLHQIKGRFGSDQLDLHVPPKQDFVAIVS